MPFPALVAYIAFGDTPFGTPTFADVSPYIRQHCTVKRGRPDRFSEFRTGTATLTLKNTDRRFDPDYASGFYAPDVLPMKQIAIGATWNAGPGPVTYWLFTGFIDEWRMRDGSGTHEYADLTCVDGFEVLSRLQLGTPDTPITLDPHVTEQRVIDVLDEVGWPGSGGTTGPRNIDPIAALFLQASTLDGVPALEHLQLVARSEDGQFFIDREGKATLQGRGYRDALSTIDTWGDAADGSELPYKGDIDTSFGLSQVWNNIEIQNENGAMQTVSDATSITNYLTRTYSRTGLLLDADSDALSIATEIKTRFKDPKTRASRMRPNPQVDGNWPIVLQRDLSDRVEVKKRSLVGGTTLTLDCHIEGIACDIQRDDDGRYGWEIDWSLSSR